MPCRRILLLPFLFFLFAAGLSGLTGEEEIRSFYPCREGSEKEFSLLEYLTGEFSSREIEYQVIRYDDREDLHSFSRSLRIDFAPSEEERIFLAVSLDGEDSYSYMNTLTLYNLALRLKSTPPRRGVTLLFLGGEENTVPVGTTAFLEDFAGEESLSLLYLDIDSDLLRLVSSTKGYNAPLWFLKSFAQALTERAVPFAIDGLASLFNRAGFGGEDKRLTPWQAQDIPALLLTGTETRNGREVHPVTAEQLTTVLADYISHSIPAVRDDREKNYLILSVAGDPLFIGEWHSILTIISLLSLFTVTIVFQSRNFILNFRKNRSSLWVLALIFALVFILLYLSTLIMEEILLQKNIGDLWMLIPRNILFFKLLLTLLFSSLFLFIFRGIPLPRSPHFYSYGAILFAGANLLMLASRDISLTYYALWLLLCLFPFALSRKLTFKSSLTILAPLPILYLLITVVLAQYPGISRYILMDRIEGNLVITAFLMPYILMLTSLHYSRFYYHRERRSYTAVAIFVLAPAAALYILVRIILFSPFSEDIKQPFELTDRMDYSRNTRTIVLTSSQEMGSVDLKYDGLTLVLNSLGDRAQINGRIDESLLSYRGELSSFLNRKRLTLILDPEGRPDSLEIRLFTATGEGQITVYDCNFPYINRSDNTESRIIIGNRPLFPLELDLTVTLDSRPSAEFIMTYENPPLEAPEITNKPARITHRLILKEVLDLSPDEGSYLFPPEPKK